MSGRWVSLRPLKSVRREGFSGMAVAIGRDARPQARGSVRSQILEGAVLAPHCLKASRGTSPLRRFRPVPEYGVRRFAELATSSAWPRPSRAFCPVETRRFAMRVLSLLGNPSLSRSGPAVSTPIRKVSGLRCYHPAADGGDDERATLARNAALHIPTCVRSRHGALWQAAFRVAAHGAVDADPQGSRERRWSRGRHRRHSREKADADDGAWASPVAPSGGGPKGLRPNPERRPPHCSARPCPGRFVRASWFRRSSVSVSILTRTALQNAWSFRERARLARRNSVSTRLMAFSAPNRVTSSSTPHPRTRMRMRCSCGEGEGVKSLWRSILDIRQRVRLEGLK